MSTAKDKSTETEAPVAARTRLNETENPRSVTDNLKDAAAAQEKQQADELKAGKTGGETKDGPTVAHNRSARSTGVQNAFIDQMTRRSLADVMEGHFCTIDRTHKDVNTDLLPEGEDGYGVYLEPAAADEDGYPVTARVRLKDATGAEIVVPYDALRPTESRGR